MFSQATQAKDHKDHTQHEDQHKRTDAKAEPVECSSAAAGGVSRATTGCLCSATGMLGNKDERSEPRM